MRKPLPGDRWAVSNRMKRDLAIRALDMAVEPWGDRRQEIVFIGAGIDWPRITARLNAALVAETTASSVEDLPDYSDPFPLWRRAEQSV